MPAGEFLMGSEDAEEDERPVHRVQLDEFLIGVQPVSNAEYARFIRETGHRPPAIYELPLVVAAGGTERERTFRKTGAPYVWVEASRRRAGWIIRSPSFAMTMRPRTARGWRR